MDKRYIRLSLCLLPFTLYTALMFRMIDNVYQADVSVDKVNHILSVGNGENVTSKLRMLAERYNRIDTERKALLEVIQRVILEEEHDDGLRFIKSYVEKSDVPNNVLYGVYRKPFYPYNCENIYKIHLRHKIGHGVTKQVFLGEIDGRNLAIKMVTRHQKEVRLCIENLQNKGDKSMHSRSKCYAFSNGKLMKEILLLEQLHHEGFAELLGYCVRNEESESTDLREHGIISVFELGKRFTIDSMQYLSLRAKINHAIHLLKFLAYLEHSPLGSLRIRDFKEDHFLLFGSEIKMVDLDDVDNLEPSCDVYTDDDVMPSAKQGCEFGLQCQTGLCVGHNAKHNLKMMNKLFLRRFLHPDSFPTNVFKGVNDLVFKMDALHISAEDALIVIEDLYSKLFSGL